VLNIFGSPGAIMLFRPKEHLCQVLAILACLALGALIGWANSGNHGGAGVGGFVGFVLAVLVSGLYFDAIRRYGRPTGRGLLQAFLVALVLPSPRRVIVAAAVAVCLVGVNCWPSPTNLILLVAAGPVILLNPDFQPESHGPDVGWFFFGPWIKSVKGFVIFSLYFMAMGYSLLLGLGYKALREREEAHQAHSPRERGGKESGEEWGQESA
jgi:hypothetical protein